MDTKSAEKVFLYSPEVLKTLDFSKTVTSPSGLASNLVLRPLRLDDFDRGFLQLLTQLTTVGDISEHKFKDQFIHMQNDGKYYITVVEDVNTSRIVCAATLFIEYKFIHNTLFRGRIEDVVVDSEYRGKRLGLLIIETLKLLAQKLNCYKLTLDCRDDMIEWYSKLGFVAIPTRANMLSIRFVD